MIKKNLLAILFFIGIATNAPAQSNNIRKFGISADVGMATGVMSTRYPSTFGISVYYQLPVATNVAVIATAGYASFIGSDYDDYTGEKTPYGSYDAFPIKAGIKYYFNKRFYTEGQLGAAFGTQPEAKPAFAYAPGIGIEFDSGFGFGIRYEAWVIKRRNPDWNEDLNQVAVRIAYSF
jgi:hypothetical protein